MLENPPDIARRHAVGQACSVVHTAGHALGYPLPFWNLDWTVAEIPWSSA